MRLLIQSGADVNIRDEQFDSASLCRATVGSGELPGHHTHGDWVATVQALLDAGASSDGAWVTGKPPSDEVAALLLAHGIGPAAS